MLKIFGPGFKKFGTSTESGSEEGTPTTSGTGHDFPWVFPEDGKCGLLMTGQLSYPDLCPIKAIVLSRRVLATHVLYKHFVELKMHTQYKYITVCVNTIMSDSWLSDFFLIDCEFPTILFLRHNNGSHRDGPPRCVR